MRKSRSKSAPKPPITAPIITPRLEDLVVVVCGSELLFAWVGSGVVTGSSASVTGPSVENDERREVEVDVEVEDCVVEDDVEEDELLELEELDVEPVTSGVLYTK